MSTTRVLAGALALAPILVLANGCGTPTGWRAEEALTAETLELQVDAMGRPVEMEYHVDPQTVPRAVRDAMDALHAGGRATGAEKEYLGPELFWELSKEIDGREVEAMFRPDGTLYAEEAEVAVSAVPAAVTSAVARRMDGRVTTWEEIRDGERRLVEYHAKVEAEGRRYKIRVTPAGDVLGVVREVPAEIEVPVGAG